MVLWLHLRSSSSAMDTKTLGTLASPDLGKGSDLPMLREWLYLWKESCFSVAQNFSCMQKLSRPRGRLYQLSPYCCPAQVHSCHDAGTFLPGQPAQSEVLSVDSTGRPLGKGRVFLSGSNDLLSWHMVGSSLRDTEWCHTQVWCLPTSSFPWHPKE